MTELEVSLWRTLGGALFVAGLLFVFVRCDLAEPIEHQSLVVEAFLKTGEELPTVTLRRTRPMDEPGERQAGVEDADVELLLGESSHSYEPVEGSPGQYAPTTGTMTVPGGSPWELTVEWQGETARARGTTPPPIEMNEVCVSVPEEPVEAVRIDSLRRDSLDIPAEQQYIYPIDVTVQWSTEGLSSRADTTYWVRAQLPTASFSSDFVELFLQPAEIRREDRYAPRGENGDRREWEGVYAVPVDSSAENDYFFPRHHMTVALTRGDSAFTSFARSRTDPERREPISNVEDGLGIATAVAVDTAVVDNVSAGGEYCRGSRRDGDS